MGILLNTRVKDIFVYEYLTYNTIPIVILSAYENIDIGRSAHFLSA